MDPASRDPAPQSIDLIGVCFDGSARERGQAWAPRRLREAGLLSALPDARGSADITIEARDPKRGPLAGLFNERAVLEMVTAVYDRVHSSVEAGRFPLLYGGDCAVLLGAVPALHAVSKDVGLLFIDGHEDATTMEGSTTGEAANMEIALLLGLTGDDAPDQLRRHLPALGRNNLVMLGQRDAGYRDEIGAPTIANQVRLYPVEELRSDPAAIATMAVERLLSFASGWWLHIDLDVLDGAEFKACGAASDPAMPEGLTWEDLTTVTRAAFAAGGCRGWSIGVYNSDLDPDGHSARQVVGFVAEVVDNPNS